jgi:hypothetical protein
LSQESRVTPKVKPSALDFLPQEKKAPPSPNVNALHFLPQNIDSKDERYEGGAEDRNYNGPPNNATANFSGLKPHQQTSANKYLQIETNDYNSNQAINRGQLMQAHFNQNPVSPIDQNQYMSV